MRNPGLSGGLSVGDWSPECTWGRCVCVWYLAKIYIIYIYICVSYVYIYTYIYVWYVPYVYHMCHMYIYIHMYVGYVPYVYHMYIICIICKYTYIYIYMSYIHSIYIYVIYHVYIYIYYIYIVWNIYIIIYIYLNSYIIAEIFRQWITILKHIDYRNFRWKKTLQREQYCKKNCSIYSRMTICMHAEIVVIA